MKMHKRISSKPGSHASGHRLVPAVLVLGVVLAGARADAAGPFTIAVGGFRAGTGVVQLAHTTEGWGIDDAAGLDYDALCADYLTSDLNGVAWRSLDARPYAGRVVEVKWSATQLTPELATPLIVTAWTSRCREHSAELWFYWPERTLRFGVPSNARYLLFESLNSKDISFTIRVYQP